MSWKWRFGRPSAAMAVSLLALFVALGGVGAVAGGVLTTKKVKKISRQQVFSLAPGLSVASAKKANDADTVGGASLGSLTVGRSANSAGECDLTGGSSTFGNCGTMSLTLPRSGRVFVDTVGTWRAADVPPLEGNCRIAVDGTALPATNVRYGESTATFDQIPRRASVATNTVTDVLGAGAHSFRLECNDPTGTAVVSDTQISAVMIGTD